MDIETLKQETEVEYFAASTKGGQRANRKKTGVKLRHIPSGIEAKAKGRSQARNLEKAFEILQQRIEELNKPEIPRISTEPTFGSRLRRVKEKKDLSKKKALRRKPEL